MKRIMKYAAAALAACTMSIGTAHAVMVTQWNYYNELGFSGFTGSGVSSSGNSGAILGLPTKLEWGTTTKSDLISGGSIAGVVNTNGALVPGVQLHHDNFPIALGFSLDTADMLDALQLTATLPSPPFGGGPTVNAPTLEFHIKFIETLNAPANGICFDGSLVGAPENAGGCRDLFVLLNPGELVPVSFVIDDFKYTVTITGAGLQTLAPGACAALGLPAGCVGFPTQENRGNDFNPGFMITAQFIPEPDALALIGLSLAIAGVARRRRD